MARKQNYKPETKKKIAVYRNSYNKEHYKVVTIKLNVVSDAKVIAKLDRVKNKTDYVRDLISKDLKTSK